VDADPPEYPAVVEMTPLTRSNTDWVPQKQPPAKTAVCFPLLWARGLSLAGAGIGGLAAALHPVEAARAITRATNVLRIAKELSIQTSVRY
jgi:hypothetical protein